MAAGFAEALSLRLCVAGRFISLEPIVEGFKESYDQTLETSSQGWQNSPHNITPWLHYYRGP